ncbi:hypothetical protein FV232_02975 [Methylobacterium sp. WL30]|uniref:hypothetical protein n=1 Tax=unclassified Methylobacterium TaxID=2615210 RepID=UPI0011CA3F11|nr:MULTISPECIES: hypothetical protein [unclassified Methylobacterium]TXN26233.1 hypothetical protein FV225_23690 [Methylobacterium sp. WL93]TXN43700.1 hypothetical protein FV227_27610 [Methylobacterium sp. WL119]TXN70294.1 hypothetical protein FV232_02975 [Methylobacterium sp. WL30]
MPPVLSTDPPDAARAQLAALGLDNFENAADVARRQHAMVRALGRTEVPPGLIRRLGQCTPEACGLRRCRDGCHHGQRGLRANLIPQADSLLRAQPGQLLAPTLVHPRWEAPYAAGPGAISIPAVKQHVKRGFMRLTASTGKRPMAVGAFEVSLNRDLAGVKTWAGQVHLIVTGATRDELHAALGVGDRYPLPPYAKPLVVEDVSNTARQQAYALKRYAEQRIAYLGKNGRQARNHLPLDGCDQRTFDRWLCGLSLGERVILVGCKRLNGQLVSLMS